MDMNNGVGISEGVCGSVGVVQRGKNQGDCDSISNSKKQILSRVTQSVSSFKYIILNYC